MFQKRQLPFPHIFYFRTLLMLVRLVQISAKQCSEQWHPHGFFLLYVIVVLAAAFRNKTSDFAPSLHPRQSGPTQQPHFMCHSALVQGHPCNVKSLNHIQVDLERHKNESQCSINQSKIAEERLSPNQHPPQPGEHPRKGAVVRQRSRPSFVHLTCSNNLVARGTGRSFSVFNEGEKHRLKPPCTHSLPEDQAPAEHAAHAGQPSACHDRNPGGQRWSPCP